MSLKVNICGIEFNNPVIAASGTFGFGKEFADYIDINKLGGISSKGLTLHKNLGNKGIRIYETAAGIMNSIGLQNPGIEYFIKEELPFLETKDAVTIANLGGHSVDEYVKGAILLDKTSVPIIELNISCPNVKEGGMAFGTNPKKACEVIEKVRKATKKVLKIAEKSGADCISLVNTFNALAIDVDNKKAVFENKTAGLSGPCIKPIALRMVYEASNAINLPIIGMGGISNYRDCLEFIMAGASAVQVGTSNFVDFNTMINIVDDLEKYMQKENLNSLEEIRKII